MRYFTVFLVIRFSAKEFPGIADKKMRYPLEGKLLIYSKNGVNYDGWNKCHRRPVWGRYGPDDAKDASHDAGKVSNGRY